MGDETDSQRRLARAIQEAMDAARLTPPKLAAKLGVAPKTVNRWVNGEAVPSVDPPPVPEYPLAEYLVREAGSAGVEEGIQRARRPRQQRPAS